MFVAVMFMTGVALLAVFTRVELRTAEPPLQLRILADRMFRTASLQMAVGSGGAASADDGRDDGPLGRAGARRARPPLSAALSWRGD